MKTVVLPCKDVDEFSCGSSSCSGLAPGWMSATADVRAGAGREGWADGTHGGHSAWLAMAAECETWGSGPAAGSAPALHALSCSCLALVVLLLPFTQHIVNCFFHKIMGTCPPHIFKFPLPGLDEWMALLSLFSLLLDWLLCQPWRIMLFSSNAFTLPLLILSTVTCQVDWSGLLNGLLYQHTRIFFSVLSLFLVFRERDRSEH